MDKTECCSWNFFFIFVIQSFLPHIAFIQTHKRNPKEKQKLQQPVRDSALNLTFTDYKFRNEYL